MDFPFEVSVKYFCKKMWLERHSLASHALAFTHRACRWSGWVKRGQTARWLRFGGEDGHRRWVVAAGTMRQIAF